MGFLTVFEIPSLGFGGGLLITSSKGRPVEFHCTAPVNANRAQEILYGRTLRSFLLCDQIGAALLKKARSTLNVVVTDTVEMLELASAVNSPFALIDLDGGTELQGPIINIDSQNVQISYPSNEKPEQTRQTLQHFTETLPLSEPFERIQQAIAEAHKVAA